MFRHNRRYIRVIVVSLILIGLLIVPLSGAYRDEFRTKVPQTPSKTSEQLYKEFAQQLLSDHPEIKTMSNLDKAKYAFSAYSKDLWDKNKVVNANIPGRLRYGGDYTCGWHTENLQAIMRVLGVTDVHSITADKNKWKYSPDVNRNHIAPVVIVDGIAYVFDIWKMAVENDGEYRGFADLDLNNGMLLEDWAASMKSDGYVQFTGDSETVDDGKEVWDPSAQWAIKQRLANSRATLATGSHLVDVPNSGYETVTFAIPEGYHGGNLKATYDFTSAKPGNGAFFEVRLSKDPESTYGTPTGYWSTKLMGSNWGSNSGKITTSGSLDNLLLPPGTYSFTALKHETSPSDRITPIRASLSYTVV
jgi:hypothetical protein